VYRSALDTARSFLFVPGHRPDRFDKALASDADVVIVDLEDAVAPADKPSSREHVRSWLERAQAIVRVNGSSTPWFLDDLDAARAAAAIMIPKAECAADVAAVHQRLGPHMAVIPLIESPAGLAAVRELCGTTGVSRVAFGNVDFATVLGVDPRSHAALLAARSAVVYASAEAGCAPPIDGVTLAVDDDEQLLADCRHARELGFGARLCIHPRQLAEVRRSMSPTETELAWARSVLAASAGAVSLHDGQMVDEPVLARARHLLGEECR
jgi:citrate lyase subunit beta/citryl-CoA lyase